MTYSLTNKCAKNYYNRALIVQVIAENVVTCFFETQCRGNKAKTVWDEANKEKMLATCKVFNVACICALEELSRGIIMKHPALIEVMQKNGMG